ncbi:hypothetical protein CJU89_4197 [Yarrowia sp. B02]|nr:hypothetical protein CJU89_4197 [Yarrowia sp. B02]
MAPSRPRHTPLTVPDDNTGVTGPSECISESFSVEPIIVISSDEEDNRENHAGQDDDIEIIELSDTERPDEPEEEDTRPFYQLAPQSEAARDIWAMRRLNAGFFRQRELTAEDRRAEEQAAEDRNFASFQYFINRMHHGISALREDPAFEEDLQRAIRASMEDSLSNYGPKNITHPEPPKETTKGYTRSVRKRQLLCCALCRCELGMGVPSEKKKSGSKPAKKRKRFSRFSDLSDVDISLSKRMFFSKCGHIYCGLCVQNIKRRRTRKQKKEDKTIMDVDQITNFKGRYVDTPFSLVDQCVVRGCNEKLPRSRGKFFKEMFT